MQLDEAEKKSRNNYWPVVIWWVFTAMGIVLKVTNITSSFLLVVGFAGLTTLLVDYVVLQKSKSPFFLLSLLLCLAFVILLLFGAFFNNGYPINIKGVIIYLVVAVPGTLWRIYRFNRKK